MHLAWRGRSVWLIQLKTRADSFTSQTISLWGKSSQYSVDRRVGGYQRQYECRPAANIDSDLSHERSIKQRTISKTYFNVVHCHYQEMRRLPRSWFCLVLPMYKRQIVQANLFVNNISAAILTQWWNTVLDKKIATQCQKKILFFYNIRRFSKIRKKIEKYDESCKNED